MTLEFENHLKDAEQHVIKRESIHMDELSNLCKENDK